MLILTGELIVSNSKIWIHVTKSNREKKEKDYMLITQSDTQNNYSYQVDREIKHN